MPHSFCLFDKGALLFVFLFSLIGKVNSVETTNRDSLQLISTETVMDTSDMGGLSPLSFSGKGDTVVIEGNSNLPPFESLNAAGTPQGFNVDLIAAIMNNLGLDYTLRLRKWSDAVSDFEAGRVHVLSGMAHTNDDLCKNMRFGVPYQKMDFAIISRKGEPEITKIEELRNRKVIVSDKSSSHRYLLGKGFQSSLILSDGNLTEDVALLLKKKCDAILTVDIVAYHFVSKNRQQQMLNVCPVRDSGVNGFSFVVHKESEELLYLMNKSLYELKVSGVYDQIYDKWFEVYEQKVGLSKIFYLILSVVLVAFLIAVTFIYITKRQIKRATHRINTLNRELKLLLRAGGMTAWVYSPKKRRFVSLYETSFIGKGMLLDEYCSYLHEQDREVFKEMIDKIITKQSKEIGGIIRCRETKSRKDYYSYELEMILGKNEKGEECVVGTLREFTEEHERAKTIERLYKENKVILGAMPIGVAIADKHGYLQYINGTAAQIFGILDIDVFLKKQGLLYDRQAVPESIKEQIRRGEEVNEAVEYIYGANDESGLVDSCKKYLDIKVRFLKDNFGNMEKIILIANDVTDSKKNEKEKERSEFNLKLALQAGGVRVGYYDVESGLFNGIYGNIRSEGLTMAQFKQMLTEDYQFEFEQMYQNVLSGKMKNETSVMRLNSDGDQIAYVENRIMAMPSESGVIKTIIGTYKDVTDIYRYQKELETSKSKIEVAILNSDLILWDYDCISQKINTVKDLVIKGATELTMGDCYGITHPDDQEALRAGFMLMYQRDDSKYTADIRIKLASSDRWQYVTVSGAPSQHDSNGRPSRYIGVVRNNTKWVELNRELQKMNAQNQLVMNNCNSGFVYLSLKYKVQWENISCNQMNCRDNDWYVVGDICYEKLGQKGPCVDCPVKRVIETHSIAVMQRRRENGSVYEVVAIPVFTKGKLEGAVLRIDDITERTRTYDELCHAKEKAERSDKLKSAFLANMSHEIRTPLNAIVGFTELLMTAETEQEREHYLKIVTMNNELLLKLINDILDLSKIEAGFVELKLVRFDLADHFDRLSTSFAQRITNPSVSLICNNPYKVCEIEFDKNRITQLIANFVINAIKFTTNGHIVMEYTVEDDGIRIEVSDTGIGIAEDKIERVFERFEKLDDFAQGTGLGMAICKAIVDACGGKIGVESTVGEGTKFWAWVPCSVITVQDKN